MTITFKSGDLFTDDAEALVNTVNCVGVMGKGVALEFKNRWPKNYRAYKQACDNGELRPGRVFVFQSPSLFDNKNPNFIVNFPTKDHWRQRSQIAYITSGLDDLISKIIDLGIKSIAIPPLGCGNGGLDWSVVRPLIVAKLSGLDDVDIRIYGPVPSIDDPEFFETGLRMTVGRALLLKAIATLERHFDGAVDRLSLQKVAYLLQAMGAPLNLDFSRNLHGPYSDVLKKALITLEKHKLIAGLQSADRSVHVTSAGYAAADDYLKANQRDEKIIDRLSKLVDGFETPFGLELLSTVHHVATMARHEPSLSAILVRIGELDESKRPSHQYQHAISVESTAMASSFPGKNNFRQNVLNR